MEYYLKDVVERIKFAREGARVERIHASPGIGSHSVGMHTFNMVTMLLVLYPTASGALIRAVVQHDIPERLTGDIPHPAKVAGVMNRDVQAHLEMHLNEQVFGHDAVQNLDEDEVKWLHGLDMLEFYCYVRDQLMLGNRNMETKRRAVDKYMLKYRHRYPEAIIDTYYLIKDHHWEYMPDAGDE